jgi:hypothetical protein
MNLAPSKRGGRIAKKFPSQKLPNRSKSFGLWIMHIPAWTLGFAFFHRRVKTSATL